MPLLPEENFAPRPSPNLPAIESSREGAGTVAARYAKERYLQILLHLHIHGAACIFEIAAALGCFDHQISGRFSALTKDGLIFRDGSTRPTPTGCKADVYQISTVGLAVITEASKDIRTANDGSSS